MADLLQLLAVGVPALLGVALLVIALWGLAALRPGRRPADAAARPILAGALIAGTIGGLIAWQLFSQLSCFFNDSPECTARAQGVTLVPGALAGLALGLAALAGAGLVLRLRSRQTWLGLIGGPFALVGALLALAALGGAIQGVAQSVASQDAANQLATRSAALSLAATDVQPRVTPDGSHVLSVHLTARLHADRAISISSNPKAGYPRFTLTAPQSFGVDGTFAEAPVTELAAGSTTTYVLTFDYRGLSSLPAPGRDVAGTYVDPAPGTWLLQVEFEDAAGQLYQASTEVTVVAQP